MAEEKLDLVSREQALRVARMLGCQGAHEAEKGWMPCGSHEEYEAIKKGKEEYLKVLAAKKKKPLPKMVQRTKRLETKSDAYYENRADAVAISKARGCGGVRTVLLAGKKYYAVCNHKAPKRGWENLDEKPITGIATLPGGGLVSGSFSGKSIDNDVEEKGFVNFVSRSTDPDTFSNAESARIRARNLGCIGIRRYTASDGKLVWLPCTNVSDYNRVTGIRGDNSPRNNPRRQGSKFGKKVLGTPIGAKPSGENVDGDGDSFTTGGIVGGKDNIPVVPTQILEHAGSSYLKDFEKQKSDLEKKFGDLRNVKNATKAFKKTFPRLKSFDLFDEEGENFSSEYTFARAITLLHLAQDKRIADTISDIGFIDGNDSKFKNTTALCAIGLIDKTEKVFISHAIHFNKSLKSTPQSGGGRIYNGWGDEIVKQMREKKVPQSEIDKFWSMYVVNHEWTHAEHNVAMFEQHNLKLDAEVYDMARFAFPNLSDDQFNARVKTAVELARKENGQNWGLLVSDDERRQQVFENMVIDNVRQLESQLAKGYRNDLQKGEVSQLGGNYPLTVSGYAAETFNELVAEKGSAYRMGHSAGNPNNPAWRKLLKFVRGGVGVENDIPNREGMSRQERRALERAQAKLKKSLEDLPFGIDWGKVKPVSLQSLPKKNGFISIFGQCEGFTYYLKDVQDGGESKTKTLGDPIGGGSNEDGDGDGFTTGGIIGGEDKIPVAPKTVKKIVLNADKLLSLKITREKIYDRQNRIASDIASNFSFSDLTASMLLMRVARQSNVKDTEMKKNNYNHLKLFSLYQNELDIKKAKNVTEMDEAFKRLYTQENATPRFFDSWEIELQELMRTSGVIKNNSKDNSEERAHALVYSTIRAWTDGSEKAVGEYYHLIEKALNTSLESNDKPEFMKKYELENSELEKEFPDADKVRQAIIKSIYKDTQDWIQTNLPKGTTHLSLYRGTFLTEEQLRLFRASKKLQMPTVGSWTSAQEIAEDFVKGAKNFNSNSPNTQPLIPVMLTSEIPTKKMFGFGLQGFGEDPGDFDRLSEKEILVLGHLLENVSVYNEAEVKATAPTKGMSEGVVLFKGVPKARKKPPTVTSTDINNLAIRVRQHNAKAKASQRANLRDLKNVYLRGLQDGDKTSANRRISKFLSLLMSDKPKDVKYFDDNDLLPLDHPWRNRKTTKKWAGFDDGEYGVKYAEKCCPQVVKRYHAK